MTSKKKGSDDMQSGAPLDSELEQGKANEPDDSQLDNDSIARAVLGEHIPAGDSPGEGQAKKEEPDIPAAKLWAMLWHTACGVLAGRRGEHWQLTKDEAKALGEATEPVADKWLPDFEKGPEAALIITAAMVVAPRIAIDAQLRPKAPPVTEQGEADGG